MSGCFFMGKQMSAVKNLSIRLAAVGGDKVRQEFKNLGTDGDKAFRRITQVIQPANDNLKALDATARSFNEVIRQGTALFGAYLGLQGLKNTFSAIFSANTSFEQLSGSLKTVTGSAKGAQEAFSLIEKFAIDTPYQLNEIVEAFIQLKALGLEPSEAALVSYGNTASAFGKNIKDFVGAVAAATIGKTLTFAVKAASKAFFTLAENADVLLTILGARFGSQAILGGITALRASVGYLQVAMTGLSVSTKSAIAGIVMMSRVSKLAAAQMALTATAAGVLKGALALIGGPAGLAILAGMAIYKLVDSHDVAKRAAEDHAETLQKLKDELKATAEEASKFSAQQTKDMAMAEWGLKLKTAEQNIKDLEAELKKTGGLSLTTRFAPNAFLKDYEIYAKETADILRQSKIDLEQYQKEIWEIAAENPDFQPKAQEIQDKILLLKAAEQDARRARDELKYLQNPELRPKEEVKTEVKPTISIDAEAYKKNIEDIKNKILELKTPYEQAMAKADEWRKNALKNLDASSADYQKYKEQIDQVYEGMVKKADEAALQSSKSLADGFNRGFVNLQNEVGDFASLAESAVKNAFNNMEDTLTSFITTGKASFSDFANAIISDLTRIIIRQSITQPLMNGLGSYFGFAMAHTGGIVGADNLALKSASPFAFAGAPRFHSGGIVGDEVPIIAKRGEGVFTREQMKALGDNGSTVNISVNVVNNAASDVKASVSQSNQGNGKFNLDIMIEKIESSMSRNVSKGTGIAPALERRYGLNPAYGSYG